jgi:hypothetical protein
MMNLQTAISALKSAATIDDAAAARLACLAAPDLEGEEDWVEHKYAQRLAALEREQEAHARIDAREEARKATNEHKRALIASLETQVHTGARDIRIRILRAELDIDDALDAQSKAMIDGTTDATGGTHLQARVRAAQGALAAAKWARRAYRLKTGGRGALGPLTREDHLVVNPYTGRRS